MRTLRVITILLSFLVLTAQVVSAASPPANSADPPAASCSGGVFIAHEWGTFTSFSGSDGVQLEFRSALGADLPDFVYDRAEWTGYATDLSLLSLDKSGIEALQRMETPVIYFYSDRQRTARVRVDFPEGLLTEFYPPVRALGPAYDQAKPEPIAKSFLDWGKVGIIPTDRLSDPQNRGPLNHPPSLPRVADQNHYEHARETDAAFVRVRMTDMDHYERFLFYRGVGNFRVPIALTAGEEGRFDLVNRTGEKLSHVFLVSDNCCGYADVQFAEYRNVGARQVMKLGAEHTTIYQLSDRVTRALVESGLYEAEARAMVKTWRDSWFAEPGLRVFYILPRRLVDELLPLTIDPPPTDLVRVFVGRLEYLSKANEQRIAEIVSQFEKWSPDRRDAAIHELGATYSRFAEPALRRVAAMTTDPLVRRQAEKIIARLRGAAPANPPSEKAAASAVDPPGAGVGRIAPPDLAKSGALPPGAPVIQKN